MGSRIVIVRSAAGLLSHRAHIDFVRCEVPEHLDEVVREGV